MSTTQELILERRLSVMASRGIPIPEYVSVFSGRTYEEFVAFLSLSKRVPIPTFDTGLKSLQEFWKEHVEREMILALASNGVIDRHADSSRIKAIVSSLGIRYREVGRMYLRTGTYLQHARPKWAALTETGKYGETPLETAINCLVEELDDWGVPIETLECLNEGNPEIDIHDSSVYLGIRSVAFVTRFELDLPEPIWGSEQKLIKDGNVESHIKEFPYSHE